jgi:hypothetical protein
MQLHPGLGSNLKLEKGSKQNCDLNTMLSFKGNLPIGIQEVPNQCCTGIYGATWVYGADINMSIEKPTNRV